MKILHVIAGDDNGGAGNHVLNICNEKNQAFYNEIAFLGKGILYDKAISKNIKNEVFKKATKNLPLIDYINKSDCHLVVFHGARTSLIHLIYRSRINKKTVATIHSDFRYDFLNSKIKLLLFTPLSILGLKTFKNYITISNNLKLLLEEKSFKGGKFVVNNAIDIEGIKRKETEESIRNKYHISKEDFVFGMVGRFHPIKNHINVIEAFSRFIKEGNKGKLLLIGDGDLRGEVEKKIKGSGLEKSIFITGFVDNPIDYLKLCDCSIIASFSEGGAPPLVMLEAAYVKVPVMATKVGDLERILEKQCGYIIKDQSSEAIYETMKKAYEDQEIQVKGENGERLLYERFTLENFWATYEAIYKNIING
ncbi:glycosyltransferase [Clostridium sp. UBA4548]|uniref:glycosyltransferase n=1 Tax=Clostridium sp. UBA4548 TaxID=1946361 RepID=UPI0025B87389|nr:glycosyltransferase [Clostridium sp. UBA4548]